MAKVTTLARPPIVIAMPRRRGAIRRVARAGARRARRLVSRRALPVVGTAIAAAVVGGLQGSGRLDFLPEVMGSKMATLGIGGYMLQRMSSNQHLKAAGFAALVAAAFDFGRVQGGGASGDENWGWGE